MKLSYEYITRAVFNPGIYRHNILLRCLPSHTPFQKTLEERIKLSDSFWKNERTDGFNNRIITAGNLDYHSTFEFVSSGVVEQSTYCIPDSHPHPMYRATGSKSISNNLDDIISIMHHVHDIMEYVPGITTINTPINEVMKTKRGVCQDYSHMMIQLCREQGYHARYVCGLMIGEGATHAWVEVHDGQCWYAFDPTNDTAIAYGYIKLAHGRCALDCPVNRGTYMGISEERTYINVSVREI